MKTLILVPTALEAQELFGRVPRIGACLKLNAELGVGLCGFGLSASAVLATRLISAFQPDRVLLCGIAGSHDIDRLPLLRVVQGARVRSYGIGIGGGAGHRSGPELGFPEIPGLAEVLELDAPFKELTTANIVSVTAASADSAEAQLLRTRHPDFLIEDMESWSVALAAKLANLPIHVLRAVSNEAGDREKSRWQIRESLHELSLVLQSTPGIRINPERE